MKSYFGIKNTALIWISSYLKSRKVSVHIDEFTSDIKIITFSVPQGSILGPTLFNCYVSTLMEVIPETEKNCVSRYVYGHALINSFLLKIYIFLNTIFRHYLHTRPDG